MVTWIRTESADYLKSTTFDYVGLDDQTGADVENEGQKVSAWRIDESGDATHIHELFAVSTVEDAHERLENFMGLLTDPDHGPILDVCMEVL